MTYQHTFIDPSSLSHSPSPAPESEAGSSTSGSRKRPRTESSSEDRKEARAHRNRIAAQNSRDRRKAQFSYLERRVAELEEENRALRAGMNGAPLASSPVYAPTMAATQAEEESKRREAREREKENEELKERIKTLERGWDAVMKALAAQGLPLATNNTPAPPQSAPITKPTSPPTPPTASTLPTPIYPISPAPSPASLDFSPLSEQPEPEQKQESTRHLAAGDLDLDLLLRAPPSPLPTPTPGPQNQHTSPTAAPLVDDEAIMEDLLREILAPIPPASPNVGQAAASLPPVQDAEASAISARPQVVEATAGASETTMMGLGLGAEWGNDSASELEMQRILAEMGVGMAEQSVAQDGFELSELDVEMGWEMTMGGIGIDIGAFSGGQGVGVF